jgi:Domain of unknown function (DUF4082)/Bacterial Ig-like domain (group 1)
VVNAPVSYTATIQDTFGNRVTTATNVISFTVTGVTGSFAPASPIAAAAGRATTSLTALAAGAATVTATATGLTNASASLTVSTAGAPAKLLLTPASASTTVNAAVSYTATIQDSLGNTVTGASNPITFSVSGVLGSFTPVSPITPSAGLALTSFNPLGTGTATVTATATGLTGASATLSVTSASGGGGQSLFTTQTPSLADASDGVPYELGMKFTVARPGQITGVRYWKSPSDGGSHTGRIWSASGTLLASTPFVNETASGWQQQALSAPLVIQANTTYVVSVNIASHYPFTNGGLATQIVNGDISSVADGNNGVFGGAGAFPASAYQSSNYFRDVVFVADQAAAIAKVSGDNQNGAPGAVLPSPLIVSIMDANHNPMVGVPVTFAITEGGGSLSPASANTAANGQASTTLTLGSSGLTSVSATAAGVGSVSFRASVQNATYLENQQPGTTAWNLSNPVTTTAPEIAGYASATSVNKGGSLPFKITLAQPGQYTINVYRLGYYGGSGGRLMGNYGPFSGVSQSPCNVTDATTSLIECNWNTSFTLAVGSNWASGLYIANITTVPGGKQSQIWFVVRDDSSHSDLLFQSSFTTFHAYNNYGDSERRSLYGFNSTGGQKALKVSLDRPFGAVTVDPQRYDKITTHERNMVRWLESQSYDVTYLTNMDVHTTPALLLQHKTFLSVGHDEYWSLEMRNAVEQARDAGVNLGFFTANAGYWRVRFEPSSTGEPNRVMVCYKDPLANDPVAPTYLWRGVENNRPENALLGVMYVGDDPFNFFGGYDYIVSNASDPYYNNTGLTNGTALTKLVGYEWDAVVNNGATPNGLVVLSQSTPTALDIAPGLPPGTNASVSNAVRYTAPSGAKVFSSGSIQFAWGVDSDLVSPARADSRVKQFVINILANMGAKPLTPDAGMLIP